MNYQQAAAVDYLLNHFIQTEYSSELEERLKPYLNRAMTGAQMNNMSSELTYWIRDKFQLLRYLGGVDLLCFNPCACVGKNRNDPNSITVGFFADKITKVEENLK